MSQLRCVGSDSGNQLTRWDLVVVSVMGTDDTSERFGEVLFY